MFEFLTVAAALAGAIAGGIVCPALAKATLAHVEKRLEKYWDRRLVEYSEWARDNKGEPDAKAKGDEGALGVWLADAKKQIEDKKLASEWAHVLAEICPDVARMKDSFAELPSKSDYFSKYRGGMRPVDRIVCAAFLAVCLGILASEHTQLPYAILCVIALVVISIMALTDTKAHILPFELSFALIPIGMACQIAGIWCGYSTLTSSLIGGVVYAVIIFGSAAITSRVTKRKAMGMGDVRSTPGLALICAAAPIPALIASAATTLIVPFARFIMRQKGVLTMSTPFGPHLAAGVACGLIWPIFCGPWLAF